jgi:hypothetical protein
VLRECSRGVLLVMSHRNEGHRKVVGSDGPGSRSVPLAVLRILLQLYKPVNFCDEAVMRKGIRAAGSAAPGGARRPTGGNGFHAADQYAQHHTVPMPCDG